MSWSGNPDQPQPHRGCHRVRAKTRVSSDSTEDALVMLLELLSPWEVKAYCLTPGVALVMLKRTAWGQPPFAARATMGVRRDNPRIVALLLFSIPVKDRGNLNGNGVLSFNCQNLYITIIYFICLVCSYYVYTKATTSRIIPNQQNW